MIYHSLDQFLNDDTKALAKGPIALIFCEDDVEVDSTLRHHLARGFKSVIVFTPPRLELPALIAPLVYQVHIDFMQDHPVPATVNRVIDEAPGLWMYYGFNAEYLYHPFCETRTVGEMCAFQTEERRDAMVAFVVDAYASDLNAHPNAVDHASAHIDRAGYYALQRVDEHKNALDRQMDFFGGLRWRFEEHIPSERRRIDRVAIFKSKPGLRLRADHTFNDPEYNTYACPWHNNITAAVVSYRTAKALKRNPGSTFDISNFMWLNSAPLRWSSQQLLDLGLMEPGQWF